LQSWSWNSGLDYKTANGTNTNLLLLLLLLLLLYVNGPVLLRVTQLGNYFLCTFALITGGNSAPRVCIVVEPIVVVVFD